MNFLKDMSIKSKCITTTLVFVVFCACNAQTEAENLEVDQTHVQNTDTISSQEPPQKEEIFENRDLSNPKDEAKKESFSSQGENSNSEAPPPACIEQPDPSITANNHNPEDNSETSDRNQKKQSVPGDAPTKSSDQPDLSITANNHDPKDNSETSDRNQKKQSVPGDAPTKSSDQPDPSITANNHNPEDNSETSDRNQEKKSVPEAFLKGKIKLVGFKNTANLSKFVANSIFAFAKGEHLPPSRFATVGSFYLTWSPDAREDLKKNVTDKLEMLLDFENENQTKLIVNYTYNKHNHGKSPTSQIYTLELPMSVEDSSETEIKLKFDKLVDDKNPIYAMLVKQFNEGFGDSDFVNTCWVRFLNGEYSVSKSDGTQGQEKIYFTKNDSSYHRTTLTFIPYPSNSKKSDSVGDTSSQ